MKWYWHLLFLILSAVAAWVAGDWLSQPLWQAVEPHPVSFDQCKVDRKEWTTLVGDEERKHWWIETRAGRDPTVIRRLKLELPPLTGEYPYFGASTSLFKIMSCDAVLCHEYVMLNNSTTNVQVEMRYCLLDPVTGKLLKRFTIPGNPIGSIAGYGNKLAYVGHGFIHLFDVVANTDRSLRIGNAACLAFSPDGKLLACVDRLTKTFYFIEWEKAELIEAIQSETSVESFTFAINDTLLLAHDRIDNFAVHSRWHWNGTVLNQVSPGIKLYNKQIMPMVKNNHDGKLHLSVNQVKDWPLLFKSIFQWLTDKQFSVEHWVPKQYYRDWVVLDNQDQIQREYYEAERSKRRELYDHLSVEVEPDKQFATSTITFWNEHPVWPNALAVGMVLYLLLYVMVLGWQRLRTR